MPADDKSRQEMRETDAYGREGYKGDPNQPEEDTSLYPHSWAPWAGGWGFRSHLGYGGAPEAEEGHGSTDDDSNWDEGFYSLLIVAGALLFVFPEPATSMVGVVLILVGAIGWLVDAAM